MNSDYKYMSRLFSGFCFTQAFAQRLTIDNDITKRQTHTHTAAAAAFSLSLYPLLFLVFMFKLFLRLKKEKKKKDGAEQFCTSCWASREKLPCEKSPRFNSTANNKISTAAAGSNVLRRVTVHF
jgi:hypothetical protein